MNQDVKAKWISRLWPLLLIVSLAVLMLGFDF